MDNIEQPLFSIITITYNNAEGLEKTLQSIKNQNEKNFELIVIDGGSSDHTQEVIQNYNNIITYSISEKDRGIAHAFNKGTKVAKGQIINYLNAGDTYISNIVLSKVKNSFIEYNWDWCYGLRKRIDKKGNIYLARKNELLTYNFVDFCYSKQSISHQATFIKLTTIQEVNYYNEKYQFLAMDIELFVKIGNKYTPHQCDEYLVLYEDFGVSSQNLLHTLQLKHQIRIENLNLNFLQKALSIGNTYRVYLNSKSKNLIKKLLLKTTIGQSLLIKK